MMTTVHDLEGSFTEETKKLEQFLEKLIQLKCTKPSRADVYLIGDAFMKKDGEKLLEQYEKQKGVRPEGDSFNVLSFPEDPDFPHPETDEVYLGEIYLNPHHITRAHENITRMLVHGFLHLLGYLHETDDDRMKMEALEDQLVTILEGA